MSSTQIALALGAVERSDPYAEGHLLRLLEAELRGRAPVGPTDACGGGGPTLETTALVQEAYLRVIGKAASARRSWDDRGRFFGDAALALRRILVERARLRRRLTDAGNPRQSLHESLPDGTDLPALDAALDRLQAADARKARVVSLRYFAGLSIEQTAAAMDLTPAVVKAEWAFARAWLHRALSMAATPTPEDGHGGG